MLWRPPPLSTRERPGDDGGPGGATATDEALGRQLGSGRRRRLCCARCGEPVTSDARRAEIAGKHRHTFVNPHGFVFTIACFTAAPGCLAHGPRTTYWSWFPGYSWQGVLCRACGEHLGWVFRGADSVFYGLIADRLREEDEPED